MRSRRWRIEPAPPRTGWGNSQLLLEQFLQQKVHRGPGWQQVPSFSISGVLFRAFCKPGQLGVPNEPRSSAAKAKGEIKPPPLRSLRSKCKTIVTPGSSSPAPCPQRSAAAAQVKGEMPTHTATLDRNTPPALIIWGLRRLLTEGQHLGPLTVPSAFPSISLPSALENPRSLSHFASATSCPWGC